MRASSSKAGPSSRSSTTPRRAPAPRTRTTSSAASSKRWSSGARVSEVLHEAIVLGVRADPEPDDPVVPYRAERAPRQPDPGRVNVFRTLQFLEIGAAVPRIGFPQDVSP